MYGTARHISESGDLPVGDVSIEDVSQIHVSNRALESFRFHHGGGVREAEAQLRSMLEDFLIKSARRPSAGGSLLLAREGYALLLTPDRGAVAGYFTVHRERTWAQVKSGVRSRYKSRSKSGLKPGHLPRQASGVAPEPGPPMDLSDFEQALDPKTIHLTARVRRSYVKLAELGTEPDEVVDEAIRADVSRLPAGEVLHREDGAFEVTVDERTWLVSSDVRSLIGVKAVRRSE